MGQTPHLHDSHLQIVKRLKRADGHLRGVIDMIETGRPCLDLAGHLHAVEKAIARAKKTLIQDHLDYCLEEVIGPLARDPSTSSRKSRSMSRCWRS